MSRPAPVRLEDLAEPRFAPHVVEMRASMAVMVDDAPLDADVLLRSAQNATGLTDFGDGAFVPRLRLLVRALAIEGCLSPVGRVMAHAQLLQMLKNRLKVEALFARHPQAADLEIRAPIVIVGLPRTGTTHLHNLLAADPALRGLPYWESLEPVLLDEELPVGSEPDPRRTRCDQALWFVNETMPYFVRMHEMTTDHMHEEIQLLALDVSTMLFETMGVLPSWRDAYVATDQTASYRYLRRVLQAIQWQRGGGRWVLKSPQHLEQVGPLLRAFPDAVVVFTHRDPASVVASYVTMAAYTARMSQEPPIDVHAIGRYWRSRIEDLFRACTRDRALVPAAQSIDIRFDEFMRDDLAMVHRIYALADAPVTNEAERAWAAFMESHPRGVHGTIAYDLAQFGLDATEIHEACRFYVERFGIARESR
jgi:Sulfotransferase family